MEFSRIRDLLSKKKFTGVQAGILIVGALILGSFLIVTPVGAVDWSEWEYEPGEGLHQEEWYDPSDWFDTAGEGISYENDWWGSAYGDAYEYNGTYGYYEPYSYAEGPYEYDYYTDTWDREDEGLFDF